MFAKLKEKLLPYVVGFGVPWLRFLTPNEQVVVDTYRRKRRAVTPKTTQPVVIGMIGLVGSGKSMVARELAERIGAAVIEADALRIELRKNGVGYDKMRVIAEEIALQLVYQGKSVILDSDFVDDTKRASLRQAFRMLDKGTMLLGFVRVSNDIDIRTRTNGAEVKMREMIRRLPHHYNWKKRGGGTWVLKKPPCELLADIDTSDEEGWTRRVEALAAKLCGGAK